MSGADGGAPDGTSTDARLDALADLGDALAEETSLEELVRPLLGLLASVTGLESVFLTELRELPAGRALHVLAVEDAAALAPQEGTAVAWGDALCRLCQEEGLEHVEDVPTRWPAMPPPGATLPQTYLSIPVRQPGGEEHLGTLCGASPRHVARDERVLSTMRLFARLVGSALWRQRQEQLSRDRAEVAERRLADRIAFGAKVEHALRTPLAVLTGWATTLREGRLTDPEQRAEGLEIIGRTADRMLAQVDDLLAEARAARSTVGDDEVALEQVVASALPVLEGRPVTLDGAATVRGDAIGLAVVVEHLLENVAAHTPPGTAVRVRLARGEDGVVLVVEDDGPGLPDRDDLFEPFVTADPSPQRTGTGLGLHIVRELVEQRGGSVRAGETEGGGARFEVVLPD